MYRLIDSEYDDVACHRRRLGDETTGRQAQVQNSCRRRDYELRLDVTIWPVWRCAPRFPPLRRDYRPELCESAGEQTGELSSIAERENHYRKNVWLARRRTNRNYLLIIWRNSRAQVLSRLIVWSWAWCSSWWGR